MNSNFGETFLKSFFTQKTRAAHKKELRKWANDTGFRFSWFAYYFLKPGRSCGILLGLKVEG
jgi:hypothetical protein